MEGSGVPKGRAWSDVRCETWLVNVVGYAINLLWTMDPIGGENECVVLIRSAHVLITLFIYALVIVTIKKITLKISSVSVLIEVIRYESRTTINKSTCSVYLTTKQGSIRRQFVNK